MSETVLNQAPVPETPAAPPAEAKKDSALWREIKGIFWVLVAVLLFHSFVAKPFYIPSESMMPALLLSLRSAGGAAGCGSAGASAIFSANQCSILRAARMTNACAQG